LKNGPFVARHGLYQLGQAKSGQADGRYNDDGSSRYHGELTGVFHDFFLSLQPRGLPLVS
jgi:hypothetical protein